MKTGKEIFMRIARIVPKKHLTLIPIGISRGHGGVPAGMTR